MSKYNILSNIILAALLIYSPICSYDYWRNLKNAPSAILQWMNNNTKKAALGSTITLGTIALYLYNKYRNTPTYQLIQSGSSILPYPYSVYRDTDFDPKQQEEPIVTAQQPLEEFEKPVIIGDARISRFVNNWRDVGDIRREFEDPENWPLLISSNFKKPDSPNVDVNRAKPSKVYDIRNILLPPQPLLHASKALNMTTRAYDAEKYETARKRTTYVMRQNNPYHDFIGFITFYTLPSSLNIHGIFDGYIDIMHISKEFRGKKYAEKLMKFALKKMKQMGISRVTLTTGLDNIRAQRFYEKMGFTRTNDQPYPDDIMYQRFNKVRIPVEGL